MEHWAGNSTLTRISQHHFYLKQVAHLWSRGIEGINVIGSQSRTRDTMSCYCKIYEFQCCLRI